MELDRNKSPRQQYRDPLFNITEPGLLRNNRKLPGKTDRNKFSGFEFNDENNRAEPFQSEGLFLEQDGMRQVHL